MKILITSINAGAGHNATRDSAYDYLKQFKQFKVKKFLSKNQTLDKIYRTTINYFHPVNELTYEFGGIDALMTLALESSLDIYYEALQLLKKEKPDILLSTHPIPTSLFVKARNKLKYRTKIISLYPDYGTPHKMYFPHRKIYQPDELWVPSKEAYDTALKKLEVPKELLKRIALLPPKEFIQNSELKMTKQEWRKKLISNLPDSTIGSIKPDIYTIAFLAGGMWIKKLEELYDYMNELYDEDWPKFQLLIVCGKDKRMHKKFFKDIQDLRNKIPFASFGFVNRDEMSRIQLASDLLVVGSLGAGMFREYMCTRLVPILVYDHLGAQEAETLNVAVTRGLAKYIPDNASMTNEIISYVSSKKGREYKRLLRKNEKYRNQEFEYAKKLPEFLLKLK